MNKVSHNVGDEATAGPSANAIMVNDNAQNKVQPMEIGKYNRQFVRTFVLRFN